jgi:hypothetical protein
MGAANYNSSLLKGSSPMKQQNLSILGNTQNHDKDGSLPVFNSKSSAARSHHGSILKKQEKEVDLFCICAPHERTRAAFRVQKEHDVHANIECPFRRLNRVQKWQLK